MDPVSTSYNKTMPQGEASKFVIYGDELTDNYDLQLIIIPFLAALLLESIFIVIFRSYGS